MKIKIVLNVVFTSFLMAGIVQNAMAYNDKVDIWITKNDGAIMEAYSSLTNNYSSLAFSSIGGWAKAISKSPCGSSQTPNGGLYYAPVVVGGEGAYLPDNSLWRFESGWWNELTIIVGGVAKQAYDVGISGSHRNNTLFSWAVGEAVNYPMNYQNIYEYTGGQWYSRQGIATRIDVAQNGNPWVVNQNGDVWELIPNTGWVWRGRPAAYDIGVDRQDGPNPMAYVTTTTGKLMRFNANNTWSEVAAFTALGKSAKKVDVSYTRVLVTTTDGLLYVYGDPRYSYSFSFTRVGNVTNVDDVSGYCEPLGQSQ
jgi:hypothetical protein